MADKNVIDIRDLIRQKKEKSLLDTKKSLDLAIDDLDIDIEDILSTYVNPDSSMYNDNIEYDNDMLLSCVALDLKNTALLLKDLGLEAAANDIEAVVNKLNNNFYGDNNEV